jgi:DNA-binding MarR family transcriptional regulator
MSDTIKHIRVMYQLGNVLMKYRNKKAATFNLTSIQTDVLGFLLKNQEKDEITQFDVQKYFMLSHPAITGIIKRLEEKGFLKRGQSARDARYNCLHLTQKAFELEDALAENALEAEKIVLKNMTNTEQAELYRLLQIALDNICGSD